MGGSLAVYREVPCGSEDHEAGFLPMLFGTIFYVIAYYALSMWAVIVTPQRIDDAGFRETFRFLLARWRSEVWYWGMIMTTRNLFIAISGLSTRDATTQLVIIVTVIMLAKVLASSYQPWRAAELNRADVATCFMLSIVGMFGVTFLCLGDRVDLLEQMGEPTADLEDRRTGYAWAVL